MNRRLGQARDTLAALLIAAVVALWAGVGFAAAWHAREHEAAEAGVAPQGACGHPASTHEDEGPKDGKDDCGTCVLLVAGRPKAMTPTGGVWPCVGCAVEPAEPAGTERASSACGAFVRTSRGPPAA